jgi:HEAT repeat protein
VKALDEKALRLDVLRALEHLGPTAKAAVPALVRLSKTGTGYDRLGAAQALWKIDQNADFVVPALIELLKDPFLPIRVDAARSLGDIGPGARAAVPSLVAARDYIPQPHPNREAPREREAPQSSELTPPAPKEMPEDEFYPRVRDAAAAALTKIEAK